MLRKLSCFTLVVFLLTAASFAQVRLPKLLSDGMVLQRETKVKIWGWAAAGEKVNVNFLKKDYKAVADENGNWKVELPKMKAGGPFEMKITAGNSITIKDVLIGDVWICSGQSNMELQMKRVDWNYPGEIKNSTNNFIRQFNVPQKYDFNVPQKDVGSGEWKSANPENTPDFSAVAYFFAKDLYEKYKVPVGLINSSLGGSPVESWISSDSLKKFPKFYNEAEMFKDSSLIKIIEEADRARSNAWYSLQGKFDEGYKDQNNLWRDPSFDDSSWDSMSIPGYWADTKLGFKNGVVWFRKNITVPKSIAGKPAKLIFGRVVDADSIFVNGKLVGNVTYQYPPRRYDIPEGLLKEGNNSIVVRVINNSGRGGFVLDKTYAIDCEGSLISLDGNWKYKLGVEMLPLPGQTFIRWKPIGLYNAMISPLINYSIKGALWYQGESNTWNPGEYASLLSTMIRDWRSKWNQGSFPFLLVQLANFMESKPEPSESNWAMLREAQLKTLSVPNTGMTVTIDIGEWNDIHPSNKKDVGKRLFLAADKVAYGDDKVVYSGPIYKSMEIVENKIIVSFEHVGDGLISKGGSELKEFAIAGGDKKFVWAKAKIKNDKIVVWNENIINPKFVRYAWADNPSEANLYNANGLPAFPFRTDKD